MSVDSAHGDSSDWRKQPRRLPLIALLAYAALSLVWDYYALTTSIFRPINQALSSWYFTAFFRRIFESAAIAGMSVLGLVLGYFRRKAALFLYPVGVITFVLGLSYASLLAISDKPVDFGLEITDASFLVGEWKNDRDQLTLSADSSYHLVCDEDYWIFSRHKECEGTWEIEKNWLYLWGLTSKWGGPWEITKSRGYYFITYETWDDLDEWSGDLGLMRKADWDSTHRWPIHDSHYILLPAMFPTFEMQDRR